jgi:transposase
MDVCAQPKPGGETLTRSASISVVGWGWSEPTSSDPLWIELRHNKWPGYLFRLTFVKGQLLGVEVRRESDEARPLTAHLLQRVPLGALEREALRHVDAFVTEWLRGHGDARHIDRDLEQWYDDFDEGSRPRTGAKTERDVRLARLAKRYVETLGDPMQTEIIASEFSYSDSSVAAMVREARTRHLLTPTPQKGRPGGRLTPKALAWLGEVPPATLTAWERATTEEKASAVEQESRFAELDAALTEKQITPEEYRERLEALANNRWRKS